MPEWIKTLAIAAFGSGGVAGLIFYFLKKWIENKLTAAAQEADRKQQIRQERMKIDDELQQSYGRMFFWLHYAVTKNTANGELERAFERLQNAEEKKKNLDRKSICETESN